MPNHFRLLCVALVLGIGFSSANASAIDEVNVARGNLSLIVPDGWEAVEPRSSIVEIEFSIPAQEGDEENGRVTGMLAGGGVDANVERWRGQFGPNEGETSVRSSVTMLEPNGLEVHLVKIEGTFRSQPRGPMGPSVNRNNYRMLGAIIILPNGAEYFIKATGPKTTMDENEEAFVEMLENLRSTR